MNVTVNSQVLAAELRLLNKVVPTKPAIAILSHALFRADDALSLYAMNLELSLGMSCEAQVADPGAVALPVAKLLALVEQFTDTDVMIAAEKSKVTVKCGTFISKMQAMPVADFPVPPVPIGQAIQLDATSIQQLISRTRYAVSATSSKYVLQGALLTLLGPIAAMVATDSKRLALGIAGRAKGPDCRVVIPAKALDALGSLVGDVELTIGARHLFFLAGRRLITSRTIDAQFPAYERIIPRDNDKVLQFNRSALSAALRRLLLVAEDDAAVYFAVSEGIAELTSASAEVGSAAEPVLVAYAGPPITVCINGSYVLDFLNAMTGDTLTMALKDANSAALLTDGDDHVGVIMLMRGK